MPGHCKGSSGFRQPPKRGLGTPRSPTALAACRRCGPRLPPCARTPPPLLHPKPPPSTALCVALVCYPEPGNACLRCTSAQLMRDACGGQGVELPVPAPGATQPPLPPPAQPQPAPRLPVSSLLMVVVTCPMSSAEFPGQHVCRPSSVVSGGRQAGQRKPEGRSPPNPASQPVRGDVH